MTLVPICIQFLELLWPDDRPSWVRNWSPFNKHIHKSSVYDCTVEDVEYICNSNSTTQPPYCCCHNVSILTHSRHLVAMMLRWCARSRDGARESDAMTSSTCRTNPQHNETIDVVYIQKKKNCLFSTPIQTGSGASLTSCTVRTWATCRGQSGQGMDLTIHSIYHPRLMRSRAVPVLPHCVFTTCYRKTFTFIKQTKLRIWGRMPQVLTIAQVPATSR